MNKIDELKVTWWKIKPWTSKKCPLCKGELKPHYNYKWSCSNNNCKFNK